MRPILHLDQKIRDDVSDSNITLIPGITLILGIAPTTSLFLHACWVTQQLKLHTHRRFPPRVVDGKRLLPDRQHAGTIRQDHGGGRFKFP